MVKGLLLIRHSSPLVVQIWPINNTELEGALPGEYVSLLSRINCTCHRATRTDDFKAPVLARARKTRQTAVPSPRMIWMTGGGGFVDEMEVTNFVRTIRQTPSSPIYPSPRRIRYFWCPQRRTRDGKVSGG